MRLTTKARVTLTGHRAQVMGVAITLDGKTIVSGSFDRTIKIWDLESGQSRATFQSHLADLNDLAITPDGRIAISVSDDKTIKFWDLATGRCLATLEGHKELVGRVAISLDGKTVVSCSNDGTLIVWDISNKRPIITLRGHAQRVLDVAITPDGKTIISGSGDKTLKVWDLATGQCRATLKGHTGWVYGVVITPDGKAIISGSSDSTLKVWNLSSGQCLATFEGHTSTVLDVAITPNGKIVISGSSDKTLKIWEFATGKCLGTLEGHNSHVLRVAITPDGKTVVSGSADKTLKVWDIDSEVLMSQEAEPTVTYTSAKIVLVGDSGVGKTGLGWRLTHNEFKEHSSTHGQQFWLLNQLHGQRNDGAQCEAVLWDLAGQPDYRLIHALFLDDADLALVLFDPTDDIDAFSGIEFWLRQLKVKNQPPRGIPTMLIAARSDRGTPRLTKEELQAYCQLQGITGCLLTSAKTGEGITELIQQMQRMIPWDAKTTTVTTETFKRIKDFVLNLKEDGRSHKVILTPEELRQLLEKIDPTWKFSDAEMLTAVGHLANHGYVTRLKTSQGEPCILLAPELLNNLAASFVLEARRNQKGLGSLEEQRLLTGGYKFPELEKLTEAEKDILLDSTVVLFLEHNICFRETDPLNGRAYLVFPELINLRKPMIEDDVLTEDGVAYTIIGAVENVYASMVVLMGYTQTFTRTNQWKDQARYEVGSGQICGFRLEAERAGELDFMLYFGTNTSVPVRMLFQSLFENFLDRRNLTVHRYEPVECLNKHRLNRAVVREQMTDGAEFTFCNKCGERIALPQADQPIFLTKKQAEKVEANRRTADQRSRFEQVLYLLKNYVMEQKIAVPECFISYVWGNPDQERWIEKSLATDLQKAGIAIVLDRWENARIGASVPRFVERVGKADRVIVVGTPSYRKKYDNNEPMRSFVVAAEGDLIVKRMIGTEAMKESVLPILLEGTEESSFPLLLHGRIYGDFRNEEDYFNGAFELLLSLYNIKPNSPVAKELRETLMGPMQR
jgi:small GTP-binding protein